MVQRGKCNVCRARKVKCDEGKPICGPCGSARRQCSYGNRRSKDTPGFALQSTRKADIGEGRFWTFALAVRQTPAPRPSLETALSSHESRLASRWSHMIGPGSLEECSSFDFAGIWVNMASRIGHDSLVDVVASYTLDCHHAFMTQDKALRHKAEQAGLKAIRAMITTLATPCEDPRGTIPISLTMLTVTEFFKGVETYEAQFHVLALSRWLKIRWTSGCWGELEEMLLRKVWLEEVEESIWADTDSELDDPQRLLAQSSARLPDYDPLTLTCDHLYNRVVRIPRLVRMFRRYRSQPQNQLLASNIATIAEEIYDRETQTQLESCIQRISRTIEEPPTGSSPLGRYLDFGNVRQFQLVVVYHLYRALICGIVSRLLDFGLHMPSFRLERVQTEEMHAAEQICMSMKYALDPSPGPPFKSIRMHDPLTVAYGAYERLEKRTRESPDHDQTARATMMKAWCRSNVNYIMELWHIGPGLSQFLEKQADAFTGGPAIPALSKRGKMILP